MSNSKKKSKKKVKKSTKTLVDSTTFDVWFWGKTQSNELRVTQKPEIKVYFDSKGLKDNEEKSKYDAVLKLY